MTYDEVLTQVIELLQRDQRVAYRAFKRRFGIDDEYIDDLKADLIKAKRLAMDEDGEVLVWVEAREKPGDRSTEQSAKHEETKQGKTPPSSVALRPHLSASQADGERLAQEALALGQRLQTDTAASIFGLQMFTLRREQGRLKELAPVVRYFVQQHTVAGAWRPALALIYSELGLTQEAQAEFKHLAQHDFADIPRDALWMASLTYLVDVCTFLRDKTRAALLCSNSCCPTSSTMLRGQCRGLLRCPLPLPGSMSDHSGALG